MNDFSGMMIVGVYIPLIILIGLFISIFTKKNKYPYKTLGIWFVVSLFLDTILAVTVNKNLSLLGIFVLFVIIESFAYWQIKKERRRLLAGFLFNVGLVAMIGYLTLVTWQFHSNFFVIIYLIVGLPIVFLISYGGFALLVFLFWNAQQVLHKESRSLANMLTLLLGVGGVIFGVIGHFQNTLFKDVPILFYVYFFFCVLFFYYFFCFITVFVSALLMNLIKPKWNKDYLIVLGAGLIDGERVTPLLAGRIDRAIDFMNEQMKHTGKKAILIMSGGQGSDEKIPESVAMKNYALENGVSESCIITEEKSTTTWENLKFSKEIMEKEHGKSYESCFVSNEYHILRAGIFARLLGLKSDGLGSKTARYFVPNAFIREFVAIVLMNKKRHAIISGLIFLAVFLIWVFSNFVK